jgi:hypothetical protein
MTDVFHDAVERAKEEDLVLVIHGDDDEELGLAVVGILPEGEALGGKLVGPARDGRVPGNGRSKLISFGQLLSGGRETHVVRVRSVSPENCLSRVARPDGIGACTTRLPLEVSLTLRRVLLRRRILPSGAGPKCCVGRMSSSSPSSSPRSPFARSSRKAAFSPCSKSVGGRRCWKVDRSTAVPAKCSSSEGDRPPSPRSSSSGGVGDRERSRAGWFSP